MYARKLVIIYRKTRLDELLDRHCTLGQVKFYLTRLEDDFDVYQDEHSRHYAQIDTLKRWAAKSFKLQLVERAHISSFNFADDDIVVVIGQDGLVANTLKYLSSQRIIAINPLPDIYDGKLLAFDTPEAQDIIIADANADALATKQVTMAKVETSIGQSMLAVNDLFIGPRTHSSLRYDIALGQQREQQSSSGIIVSTGLGASGWLSSIIAGAESLTGTKLSKCLLNDLRWDSARLCFYVREPFPSNTTQTNLVFGNVSRDKILTLTSKTAENAVIFSDGIESDSIAFTAGTTATVSIADRKGTLII
jgi:hypothetical protein